MSFCDFNKVHWRSPNHSSTQRWSSVLRRINNFNILQLFHRLSFPSPTSCLNKVWLEFQSTPHICKNEIRPNLCQSICPKLKFNPQNFENEQVTRTSSSQPDVALRDWKNKTEAKRFRKICSKINRSWPRVRPRNFEGHQIINTPSHGRHMFLSAGNKDRPTYF